MTEDASHPGPVRSNFDIDGSPFALTVWTPEAWEAAPDPAAKHMGGGIYFRIDNADESGEPGLTSSWAAPPPSGG